MDLKEHNSINKTNRHPWELARVNVVDHLLSPYLSSDGIFIDIGCGDLFFIEQITKQYTNSYSYAVDNAFSDSQINDFRSMHSHNRISIFQSIEELNINLKKKASVVFMLDVVEHIEKDRDFLANLLTQPFIDQETFIVITVPAFQSLYCIHDDFLGHYRRYNNKQLEYLTKSVNLTTITKGYFFTSLLLPRFMQSMIERTKLKNKKTTGLVEWTGNALSTSIIKKLLICDFKASFILKRIKIKLPGLSNYIICKKIV